MKKIILPAFLNPKKINVGDRFVVIKNEYVIIITEISTPSLGYQFEMKPGFENTAIGIQRYYVEEEWFIKEIEAGRIVRAKRGRM